jgi:hypothetical protein
MFGPRNLPVVNDAGLTLRPPGNNNKPLPNGSRRGSPTMSPRRPLYHRVFQRYRPDAWTTLRRQVWWGGQSWPTGVQHKMHLFFDIYDNDVLDADLDGLGFDTIERARDEALKTILELAKDAHFAGLQKKLSLELRTVDGNVVLKAILMLQILQFY